MSQPSAHPEGHLIHRIGWLRAAVLGANDGIISTASLVLGVAAAAASKSDVLLAGVAGLEKQPWGCLSKDHRQNHFLPCSSVCALAASSA